MHKLTPDEQRRALLEAWLNAVKNVDQTALDAINFAILGLTGNNTWSKDAIRLELIRLLGR